MINCNNIVSYAYFIIRKVAVKTMIDLNTDIFVMKKSVDLVLKVVKIDGDNINRKIALI